MTFRYLLGLIMAVTAATTVRAEEMRTPLEILLSPQEAAQILRQQGGLGAMDLTLQEIINAGARALAWVDQLQTNLPAEQREQIWRRIDRVGHEASPAEPMTYNPTIIIALYEEARSALLPGLADILEGRGDLPTALPGGLALADAMPGIRKVHTAYSRASRWIMLSRWRLQLSKSSRDFRPWLRLQAEREALMDLARQWTGASAETRRNAVHLAVSACPIGGQSLAKCTREAARLVLSGNSRRAERWFAGIFERGRSAYDEKFLIPSAHAGTKATHDGAVLRLKFFTENIPAEILQWIASEVALAWNNSVLNIEVSAEPGRRPLGRVHVLWEAGALPHVDSIGGSEITMDANTPLWLEHTRTVMQHEFGHVMAFPDCYTEFWDDEADAFMFYTLDPTDRMCALSGETVARHGLALTQAYTR